MAIQEWISLAKLFSRAVYETIVLPCLEEHTISLTQYNCLRYIYLHPEFSVINIARAFSISTAAATTLVDRLVRMGLINRFPNPEDRRLVKLTVTEKGLKLFDSLADFESKKWQKILARYPKEMLTDLAANLTQLVNLLLEECQDMDKICMHCGNMHNTRCPVSIYAGKEKRNLG